MSSKLIAFFVTVFGLCTLLSVFVEGSGGFNVTRTTSAISATQTTIPVVSTEGYLNSGFIWIDGEYIAYAHKTPTSFIGAIRGVAYDSYPTEARTHSVNANVSSEEASVFSHLIGFNVSATSTTSGSIAALTATTFGFVGALPKILAWDYSFLKGEIGILKYTILYGLSISLIIVLALAFIAMAQGLLMRFT